MTDKWNAFDDALDRVIREREADANEAAAEQDNSEAAYWAGVQRHRQWLEEGEARAEAAEAAQYEYNLRHPFVVCQSDDHRMWCAATRTGERSSLWFVSEASAEAEVVWMNGRHAETPPAEPEPMTDAERVELEQLVDRLRNPLPHPVPAVRGGGE